MKELGPHHKTECKKNCKGGSILEIFKIKPIYVNSSRLSQTVLTLKNPGGGEGMFCLDPGYFGDLPRPQFQPQQPQWGIKF